MYESLHNHTTTSDGLQDHLGVLQTAEQYDVHAVSFTDHDALPNEAALAQLRSYAGPVAWTVGIEISSGYAAEHPATGSLHIVGHFVDVHNKALLEHCRLAQEARQERMARIVENLIKQGFVISEADCLRASGGESVGRPHIVAALLSYPVNEARLMELVAVMARDEKVSEAYELAKKKAEARGVQEYVYALLLANDPYIPDVYVDYLYMTDMDESVKLIRDAGGVALQAHWWTYEKKLSLDTLKEYLINGRLDGIEVIGGANDISAGAYPALSRLAEETGCLTSVGADAHKPADFERYVAMPCAKDTEGYLKQLYETVQPKRACAYLDPLGL